MDIPNLHSHYEKKGQMTGGAVTTIILLITGVGVAVLVLLFVSTLGGSTFELLESEIDSIADNSVLLETFTADNTTPQILSHGFIQEGTLSIFNSTGAVGLYGLSNFTIDYSAGTILVSPAGMALDTALNGTALTCNYTWGASEVRGLVKDSIISGFESIETTGDYIPIFVLAIVIVVVLGVVFGFTAITGGVGGRGSAL